MELSDSVFLPAAIGVALCASAQQAAQEVRHDGDIRRAQAWIDHLALGAQMATDDFRDALMDLAAARREASMLRSALEESDSENLRLSLELGRLRRATAH